MFAPRVPEARNFNVFAYNDGLLGYEHYKFVVVSFAHPLFLVGFIVEYLDVEALLKSRLAIVH